MNGSEPLGDLQAQYPDTVRHQNSGEALRPSRPPSSPATHMEGQGDEGTAVSHGHSSSGGCGGAGPPGGAPSTVAASDLSRVSGDSHHSYHSQRSRWSSAATVATTVAPTQRYHDAAPEHEALQEDAELSGGSSSGPGRRHGLLSMGAAGTSGMRSTAAAALAGVAAAHAAASSSGRTASAAGADPLHAAAAAAREGEPGPAAAACSGSGGMKGRLPPRLIVFHPDGNDYAIAVDPLRAKQQEQAADAATQQRRSQAQQQRATAVAALGPAGVRPATGALPQDEGYDANFPGWRQSYMRQKVGGGWGHGRVAACLDGAMAGCLEGWMAGSAACSLAHLLLPPAAACPSACLQYALLAVLVLDVLYLAVLLALRLVWGKDDSQPQRECPALLWCAV